MQIALTPEKFTELGIKLAGQKGVQLQESTPTSGTVTTSDVTLSYVYDGTANLDVEVTKKNSWKAKIDSESDIESRIRAMFAENE